MREYEENGVDGSDTGERAMSEPGEAKLLVAVAMLTLNLESERRTAARDQNTVLKLRKDSEALRHISSRDKMLEMLQRTRENSIKGIHKGNNPKHYNDCSCGAWHS